MDFQPGVSRGLFAYVVSDRELFFHKWLFDHRIELGDSVGEAVTWRPIGDPRQSDEIYRNQRTPELVTIEADQSNRFRDAVGVIGNERIYLQDEYRTYAKYLGVDFNNAPFVIFGAPQLTNRAAISIPIDVFDDRRRTRKLFEIFLERLDQNVLEGFQVDGMFVENSLARMQDYFRTVALEIYKTVNSGARSLPDKMVIDFPCEGGCHSIQPCIDTILAWEICDDGVLRIRGISRGQNYVEKKYKLQIGRTSLQQGLLHILLESFPRPVGLNDLLRGLYGNESDMVLDGKMESSVLKARLRSLLSNAQGSLEKYGFPRAIIPTLGQVQKNPRSLVLNVSDVQQRSINVPQSQISDRVDVESLSGPHAGS